MAGLPSKCVGRVNVKNLFDTHGLASFTNAMRCLEKRFVLWSTVVFLAAAILQPSAIAEQLAGSGAVEGFGKIVRGNTVKARKEAVDQVMRQAMQRFVEQQVSPGLKATYSAMLDNHVVSNHSRFVKNYRIRNERAEGEFYRVRASVVLDDNKVLDELKMHGFVMPNLGGKKLKPPKVVMFIADQTKKDEEVENRTWWTGASGGVFQQDRLSKRLGPTVLNMMPRARIRKEIQAQGLEDLLRGMQDSGSRFNQSDLSEIGEKIGGDYLVFGIISGDVESCHLVAVKVSDRKQLGQLKLPEAYFVDRGVDKVADRLDTVSYEVLGLLVGDWVATTEVDSSITAKFSGVTSIKRYQKLVQALKAVKDITEVREHSFRAQVVELRLQSRLPANELARKLGRLKAFRRKLDFSSPQPQYLEATYK